mgnify:CR=1 FL=1
MRIGKQDQPYTAIATSTADEITIRGLDLCRDLIGKVGLTEYFLFLVTGKMPTEEQRFFADARPIVAYEAGHIQNALHLEPGAVEEWAEKLIANYTPDQPIIAYCEGEQCRLSLELAERLTWLGYEKVYYLVDGWGQWKRHGLPVDPQ